MNQTSLANVVGLIAIIVSGVMQYLTLRGSRHTAMEGLQAASENTRKTLETSFSTASMNIRGQALQHMHDAFVDDLSRYMTNSYLIDTNFPIAMRENKPWPGPYLEQVNLEDLLYNKLRLYLDPEDPSDARVLHDLDELRQNKSKEIWIVRRDRLVRSVQAAFADKWKNIANPAH